MTLKIRLIAIAVLIVAFAAGVVFFFAEKVLPPL